MKATPLRPFHQRHPRALRRWRTFPIFGAQVDDFVHWLCDRGYADTSISQYWRAMPRVLGWLRRRRILALKQLNLHLLREAYRYYRPRNDPVSRAIRCLCGFFKDRTIIREGPVPRPSACELESHRFADYLRESRHLSSVPERRPFRGAFANAFAANYPRRCNDLCVSNTRSDVVTVVRKPYCDAGMTFSIAAIQKLGKLDLRSSLRGRKNWLT